jgi:hypothetical protein
VGFVSRCPAFQSRGVQGSRLGVVELESHAGRRHVGPRLAAPYDVCLEAEALLFTGQAEAHDMRRNSFTAS